MLRSVSSRAVDLSLTAPLASEAERASQSPEITIEFSPFQLFPERRLLLESGKPVRLGSRALAILVALVESAGQLVRKEELIARTWPDTFVEDANLRVHVAALRKALGDGQGGARYLVNTSGRGYTFVAPLVRRLAGDPPAAAAAEVRWQNIPASLTRMIGRMQPVDAVTTQVRERRFVTIVGAGGIGKSTVALAAATNVVTEFREGACFVDLASLTNPTQIGAAVATALGLSALSQDPVPSLITFLHGRNLLLLLDNCEHVVAEVAGLAESLLLGAVNLHVLATSREALLAEGEWLYRLSGMGTPPASEILPAERALDFEAVQLFVERAKASLDGFELTDSDAPVVADLCRRLDGNPFAIELAAARVDVFGVGGLAEQLDTQPLLATQGRRTARARHRSLTALIDWSYDLLSETEQSLLRRLAVFRSGFTLGDAIAVTAHPSLDEGAVTDGILSLTAKSMVVSDVSGEIARHYLPQLTRAYAHEKLTSSGELPTFVRRHAERYCDLLIREARQLGRGLSAPNGSVSMARRLKTFAPRSTGPFCLAATWPSAWNSQRPPYRLPFNCHSLTSCAVGSSAHSQTSRRSPGRSRWRKCG